MVKRAVEINSGLSLVPRNTVQSEVEAGTLVAIPLAGERFARPLGAIFKPARARSLVDKAFLAALRNGELPPSQARAA